MFGSGCAYWSTEHKLIVFGGAKDIENGGKKRTKLCLRDIRVLDMKLKQWNEMNIKGVDIDGRQNFACCISGNGYYIHGGYMN